MLNLNVLHLQYTVLLFYTHIIFSQLFIDDGTNLISLYTKNKAFYDTQFNTTPPLVYSVISICLPFRLFITAFNKQLSINKHAHCLTGTKITYVTFSQYYYIPFLENGYPFSYMTVSNVNAKNTAPIQSFSEHAPSFNYRISIDTKGSITPSSLNKLYITSLLTLLVTLSLQYLLNLTKLKLQLKHFYITGLSNLAHPYILSMIVDQNILTPIWHTFVHLWVLDTLLEHLTLLGLMDMLKFKTKTSVHIFVCFYKTLPRMGTSSPYVRFCT